MTDLKSSKELVEKAYTYVERLTRMCRGDLMARFTREHKSVLPGELSPLVARAVEEWFSVKDRSLGIKALDAGQGGSSLRLGKVHLIFAGANKDASFKIRVDVDSFVSGNACYLKNINVSADKRDFVKHSN